MFSGNPFGREFSSLKFAVFRVLLDLIKSAGGSCVWHLIQL